MEWLTILALLACPLMMLFCMRGHNVTHGNKHDTSHELQQLKLKMAEMEEQNNKLMEKFQTLQGYSASKGSSSDVVEMKKGVS